MTATASRPWPSILSSWMRTRPATSTVRLTGPGAWPFRSAAWIVALGNRRGALIAYPLLTWALSLLGVWVAARWLEEDGRSVLWAAPLAVSVGMVSSMLRCLPDAAAASLLLLAIWLDRRGRRGSIAALSFAAFVAARRR